ncbi:hypothetical protein N2152v2_003318 [Parachlorella kessleri]
MQSSWDTSLQQLLQDGAITGYALISHAGAVACAFGCLSEELCGPVQGDDCRAVANEAVAQLHAAFHTAFFPTHLELCGEKAMVFDKTDTGLFAVSWGKRLGVLARYLPSGILVVTFGRPYLPQRVIPRLEAICEQLRQP